MTSTEPATVDFAVPASEERIARAAAALNANGFTAEILDDAAAARMRVNELIPDGASVLTAASETLRVSGIDEDVNSGNQYRSVRRRVLAMDRSADAWQSRR